VSGARYVAEAIGFRDALADADLVITGEGSLDRQSLTGKVPLEVARLARQAEVPCFVVAGRVDPESSEWTRHGFSRTVTLAAGSDEPESASHAVAEAVRTMVGEWVRR
jgi:glycerate kinase